MKLVKKVGEHGPLSRLYASDSVREGGDLVEIAATPEECEALAADLGLAGVKGVAASLEVTRRGRGLSVTGELRANIVQTCVVTLDPFFTELREPITASFAPEAETQAAEQRLVAAIKAAGADGLALSDAPDAPDPIVDGKVDLGALVVEFLALGLDPYPRKPGVTFVEPPAAHDDSPVVSPFSVLGKPQH